MNVEKLLPPEKLLRLGQSLAMLDAILFDDWEDRLYSFVARWGARPAGARGAKPPSRSPGEKVFSMRNGSGDFFFVLFRKKGTVLHGFAHESAMSPFAKRGKPKIHPGLLEQFPRTLAYKKTAAAFCMDKFDISFLAWWLGKKGPWRTGDIAYPKGKDPDGSIDLLEHLDGKPETYRKAVKRHLGLNLPLASVRAIYAHRTLTQKLVRSINRDADFREVQKEAKSIGY